MPSSASGRGEDLHSFPTRRSSDLLRPALSWPRSAPAPCGRGRGQSAPASPPHRSEEHTSELQSLRHLVCRLLLPGGAKIYTLSLHDALPICFVLPFLGHGLLQRRAEGVGVNLRQQVPRTDRKSTRLNSSHLGISYAVFCFRAGRRSTLFPYTTLFRSASSCPFLATVCSSAVRKGSGSICASKSPAFTSWPSVKAIFVTCPSTRACTVTVLNACT